MRSGDGLGWRAGRSIEGQPVASGHYRARPATPGLALVTGQVSIDLAGDVALEHPDDLRLGEPFGNSPFDIDAGAFVAAHAGQHDAPQRMVRLAVPTRVQAMPGREHVRHAERAARTTTGQLARTRQNISALSSRL